MATYRVALALLCGTGFTALVVILIHIFLPSGTALFLTLLLVPGSVVAHFAVGSQDIGPPLLVLSVNAIFFAVISFLGICIFGRGIATEKLRRAVIWLMFPVAILVALVCNPALNPLWPRGMTELTKQEKVLQAALPLGTEMEEARAILRSKGIQFQEETETSNAIVVDRPAGSITAATGDHVISARLETGASQFPCGYDIEIVLLFGPDERMKDQYVHRLRICP